MPTRTLAALVDRLRHRYHPLYWLRKSPLFRHLARLCDRPIWVRIDGLRHPIRVAALRNAGYLFRRPPEPRVDALCRALIGTYDLTSFWDVGSNVGYYAWLMASIKPGLHVLAIEPDVTNFSLMRQTRSRYSPDVAMLNVAVSSQDGRHAFSIDTITGATGTLEGDAVTFNEHNYRERGGEQVVETRSLDSLVVEHGSPDLLKIDVEGHEVAVLGGARALLGSSPIILIEAFGYEPPAVSVLRDSGYVVLSAETLSAGQPEDGNYLALPTRIADRLHALRQRYVSELERDF